jgi:poly-gamma-glutamate biosynthesis protein PgsC/CapC
MNAQYYHPDLVRFAFVLGIVVSLAFYERKHLTTGGIAVPGYLAFTMFQPLIAVALFAVALVTYGVVHRGLARAVVLPSGVKFSLTILVSAGLHLGLDAFLVTYGSVDASSPFLRGIGYVVPGLVAHDFSRHGVPRTLVNIGQATAVVAVAVLAALVLNPDISRLGTSPVRDAFPIDLAFLPLMVFLGLIAWLGVVRLHGLRCGGFLGGSYLTLLVLQPMELIRFLAVAVFTLVIVRVFLDPVAILFGRRRFAAYMLIGAILSWGAAKVSEGYFDGHTISVVTPSLAVVGVLLAGLLANDMDRVGVGRTLLGSLFSVSFTLTGTLMMLEVATHQRTEVIAPLLIMFLIGSVFLAMPVKRMRRLVEKVSSIKSKGAQSSVQ